MSRRTWVGVLVGTALVLASGVAISQPRPKDILTVVDYDWANQRVGATVNGSTSPNWYQLTAKTEFLPGPAATQFPPNPCRPIALVWNFLTKQDASAQPNLVPVYHLLLGQMAWYSCNTAATIDASEIVSISPTP